MADQWAKEKNILICAFQRLQTRNRELKHIGINEDFLVVNDYSILIKNLEHNDKEQGEDKMEQGGDEMEEDSEDEILEQNSAGSIYCSICKEIFLEPRSLAKHIIKEHCSKGRFQ